MAPQQHRADRAMDQQGDLSGRVALVTGAAGSLGRIVTRDLLAQGATIGAIGRRIARLDALGAELAAPADRWLAHAADLTDAAAANGAVGALLERFGRV